MSSIRHVYLLGAGFGVPLGGPLFTQLLSDNMTMRITSTYPELDMNYHAPDDLARVAVHSIRAVPQMYIDATEYFGTLNPEQFLERCDAAAAGKLTGFGRRMLNYASLLVKQEYGEDALPTLDGSHICGLMQKLNSLIRVRLAMETTQFLKELDDDSERWLPYDGWFDRLNEQDVIITTNYDNVIETLAARRFSRLHRGSNPFDAGGSRYQDIFPKDNPTLEDYLSRWTMLGLPRLLKLHGCCRWYRDDSQIRVLHIDGLDSFLQRDLVIGVPGTGKRKLAQGPCQRVWSDAMGAISEYDVLSVVGYSLPASDNDLRIRLLDSIAANRSLQEVNIVLGLDSPDGRRARQIMKQAIRSSMGDDCRADVRLLSVFAQDYLPRFVPRTEDDINRMRFGFDEV